MNIQGLMAFVQERHNVYRLKEAGQHWPWTSDPILREYRFCNVYRNLDKESRLIHDNWLQPRAKDPDVWFAMTVARLVNWWPTLEAVGYPVPWDLFLGHFIATLDGRKSQNEKVFTGAYMVRADANKTGSKAVYLATEVLTPLWREREYVRPRPGDTLDAFHQRLMEFRDMGSFMAAQIVADVKYVEPLHSAADWKTWAAPGPGSLRGLNRVLERGKDAKWPGDSWQKAFASLHEEVVPFIKAAKMPYLTGQDLQNCLCEFDKYERVRLGEGKPRSRYTPGATA